MLIIFSYIVAKENQHRKRVHFSSVFGDKPLYCCRSTRVVRSFAALQITDMLVQKVWFISLAFGCVGMTESGLALAFNHPTTAHSASDAPTARLLLSTRHPQKSPALPGFRC